MFFHAPTSAMTTFSAAKADPDRADAIGVIDSRVRTIRRAVAQATMLLRERDRIVGVEEDRPAQPYRARRGSHARERHRRNRREELASRRSERVGSIEHVAILSAIAMTYGYSSFVIRHSSFVIPQSCRLRAKVVPLRHARRPLRGGEILRNRAAAVAGTSRAGGRGPHPGGSARRCGCRRRAPPVVEPRARALHHRHRNGMVQCDHRVVRSHLSSSS